MERVLYDILVDPRDFDFQSRSLLIIFLIHDILEIFSPHWKGFRIFDWHIQELGALFADTWIIVYCTHNCLTPAIFHTNSCAIEYFIEKSVPNTYSSVSQVYNFKYFLILVLYKLISWVIKSWLQALNKVNQKISSFVIQIISLLEDVILVEECSIFVKEVFEQVVNKYMALNFIRKTAQEPQIAFLGHGLHPIIGPIIVEEVFNFSDQIFIERISIIEPWQKGDPLWKIWMRAYFPKRFVVHQNFNKLTHDKREHCNSKHKNHRSNNAFRRAHRCEISETNGR